MPRLDRWLMPGYSRPQRVYTPGQGTHYVPCKVIAQSLDAFEEKVAKALSRIIFQVGHFLADKTAKVYDDEEMAKNFGRKAGEKAVEGLTDEQKNVRDRALVLRAIMSKRKEKD